jgi:hypothetical protein
VNFELFEAAPRNAAIYTTDDGSIPGRLVRRFPGSVIACPSSLLSDEKFRQQFVRMLCQLHEETVHEFQKSMVDTNAADNPDSAHPGLVTEMIANILAAHGNVLPGGAITKRTREESLISSARFPWRRTPLWIVIRVAIERSLAYAFPSDDKRLHYKNFMLHFLTQIANKASSTNVPHELQHLLSVKLARRMAKLGSICSKFVSESAILATKELNLAVQTIWTEVQRAEKDGRVLPLLDQTVPTDQATFSLTKSGLYVAKIMSNRFDSTSFSRTFKPRTPKRLKINKGPYCNYVKVFSNPVQTVSRNC